MPPRAVAVGDIFLLDGQTCIVFKREVIELEDDNGCPVPLTEENYEDVCDYSSVREVLTWMRETPDHVLEEVDEAAIYSGDDLPRTVNGTGHTDPSEFCATSI